jgi:hypothetical protein
MTKQDDQMRLAYAAFAVFAEDGKIDMQELNTLLAMALEDGTMDDAEKRVLRNVFEHCDNHDLDPAVQRKIAQVREIHGI